ncbi:unnamed protein product [Gadus morhua 'NCC']
MITLLRSSGAALSLSSHPLTPKGLTLHCTLTSQLVYKKVHKAIPLTLSMRTFLNTQLLKLHSFLHQMMTPTLMTLWLRNSQAVGPLIVTLPQKSRYSPVMQVTGPRALRTLVNIFWRLKQYLVLTLKGVTLALHCTLTSQLVYKRVHKAIPLTMSMRLFINTLLLKLHSFIQRGLTPPSMTL